MSLSLIRLACPLLLGLTLGSLTSACKKGEAAPLPASTGSATGSASSAPPVEATPTARRITHKRSGTTFDAPPAWQESRDTDTILWLSPDKKAVLAFESYPAGTDPGATVMKVATKLHLEGLAFKGGTRDITLGKDALRGRTAEGSCTIRGEAATYSYATLSTGGSEDLLVLYAIKKSAAPERGKEAIEVLRSIRRGS